MSKRKANTYFNTNNKKLKRKHPNALFVWNPKIRRK